MHHASTRPLHLAIADRVPWRTLAIVGSIGLSMSCFVAAGRGVTDDGCGGGEPARPGQITTMVTRFNQFLPGGAAPIELVDGKIYRPSDLAPLVTAGYCGGGDLVNQVRPKLGWVWNSSTRKFTPELDPAESFPWVALSLNAVVAAAIAGAIVACGVIASRLWPRHA